jgi:CreA protein
MPKLIWLSLLLAIASFAAAPGKAADEPDLIFKRSTVFKLLTPNDKLATYGLDDPDVEGVACHFTVPERGGSTPSRLAMTPSQWRKQNR